MDINDESASDLNAFGPYTNARKLNIGKPTPWPHHRGGWKYVCRLLLEHLHCEGGVRFVAAVEDEIFEGKVISEPWVGFVHQVPKHSLRWFPDLERLLANECWKASAQNCLGIFVLSTYVKDYLDKHGCPAPVARVFYPAEPTDRVFDFERSLNGGERTLLCVGEFLRNFQAFYDLKAPGFSKRLLVHEGFKWDSISRNDSVQPLARVSDDEYDALLEKSVVFLNLYDAPANTTIVECIVRHTPILVNRLPGVVEYLGEDYPLYYESLEEAESKLRDIDLLRQTWNYLKHAPIAPKLTKEFFLASIQNSAIYRSLPVPSGEGGAPKVYDVSVVICSYNRVYNIDALLNAFVGQDFTGSFEVLLWNNNYGARKLIDELYEKYRHQLNLTVIHSTENFYCIIRLAVASLIRSDFLLICDDDVRPAHNYISTFMDKSKEYSPEAVLCCRGHVFKPHTLNEEDPGRFWTDYENLAFFDESKSDRQIHFLHADNCLIPKHLMQRALAVPMERHEFALVDDYWLSFVFSHVLKVPIWKIKADTALTFTACADDPNIALYHNPRVVEQRINFYIYHMRRGWPFPQEPRCLEERAANTVPGAKEESAGIWTRGFGGVNMFSEASEADFEKAAEAGIKVVRFGAVGDARDFRYLLDEDGTRSVLTDESLTRLAAAIRRAGHFGLKVIITLNHVPGRIFSLEPDSYDFRLWCSPVYVEAFAGMWGALVKYLRCFDNVIGYDLLNEPFTPDDTSRGYFDDMSDCYAGRLNALYERAIGAIRAHDQDTPIVLESSYWASARTLPFLRTYEDPGIVYSFHMYAPPAFTLRYMNRDRYAYPGPVRNWAESKWGGTTYWDKEVIREFLSHVKNWQNHNNIPSRNIFAGEVGVSREAEGAKRYLIDVLDAINENGWNWAVYAFRDDEWDAMNYELGTDIQNMFPIENAELFARLKSYFR